jgi:hypothetical protein
MKYGARVLSAEQLASNDPDVYTDNWADITLGDELDEAGDPPRVWAQDGEYPGTIDVHICTYSIRCDRMYDC